MTAQILQAIKYLMLDVAKEMETLEHFADQEFWDGLIRKLKETAAQI